VVQSFQIKFITTSEDSLDLTTLLTLKDGADLPPGCDTSLASVLAQCSLQEKDRNATGKEKDEVGDKEGTCGEKTGLPLPDKVLFMVHTHILPLPPSPNPSSGKHAKLQEMSVYMSGTTAVINSHQVT
jgi:hypothetical protein